MGSEKGEWEEDGEGSDKKEHLTCVPGQETTPGVVPFLVSVVPLTSCDVRF